MLHWRAPIVEGVDIVKLSFVMFFHDKRIYALDPYPADNKPHRNRSIINHPDFVEVARGPHYHMYFEAAGEEIALKLDTDISRMTFWATGIISVGRLISLMKANRLYQIKTNQVSYHGKCNVFNSNI